MKWHGWQRLLFWPVGLSAWHMASQTLSQPYSWLRQVTEFQPMKCEQKCHVAASRHLHQSMDGTCPLTLLWVLAHVLSSRGVRIPTWCPGASTLGCCEHPWPGNEWSLEYGRRRWVERAIHRSHVTWETREPTGRWPRRQIPDFTLLHPQIHVPKAEPVPSEVGPLVGPAGAWRVETMQPIGVHLCHFKNEAVVWNTISRFFLVVTDRLYFLHSWVSSLKASGQGERTTRRIGCYGAGLRL